MHETSHDTTDVETAGEASLQRPTDRDGLAIPPIETVPTLEGCEPTPRLPAHARFLSSEGFISYEEECPECDDGGLWTKDNEVICAVCYVVFDEEDRRRRDPVNPWEEFWESRPSYGNGNTKCIGGFPHVYDWISHSDLEDEATIQDVDPHDFYR